MSFTRWVHSTHPPPMCAFIVCSWNYHRKEAIDSILCTFHTRGWQRKWASEIANIHCIVECSWSREFNWITQLNDGLGIIRWLNEEMNGYTVEAQVGARAHNMKRKESILPMVFLPDFIDVCQLSWRVGMSSNTGTQCAYTHFFRPPSLSVCGICIKNSRIHLAHE